MHPLLTSQMVYLTEMIVGYEHRLVHHVHHFVTVITELLFPQMHMGVPIVDAESVLGVLVATVHAGLAVPTVVPADIIAAASSSTSFMILSELKCTSIVILLLPHCSSIRALLWTVIILLLIYCSSIKFHYSSTIALLELCVVCPL